MRDLSRRRFLMGMGKMLLIPYLPSIHLPAFAQAEAGIKRFIGFKNNHGVVPGIWDPNVQLNSLGDGLTKVGDMTSISAAAAPVLDTPELNALKAKINVINGLDNIAADMGHGKGTVYGVDMNPTNTIDQILANSSKVYPNTPVRRSIVTSLCDVKTGDNGLGRSYMSYSNGAVVSPFQEPNDLYQVIFANLVTGGDGGGGTPSVDPRVKIVDQVREDYNRLMNHRNLSASDKEKLDQHITVLNDLENRYIASGGAVTPQCEKPVEPTANLGKDSDAVKLDFFFDLIYMALKCDLTRVVMLPFSDYKGFSVKQYHTEVCHIGDAVNIQKHQGYFAQKMGEFLNRLESTPEGNGTMLDNTLATWGMELGNMNFDGDSGSHYYLQKVAMTAGGLGGAIDTGKYIQYERVLGGNSYGLQLNNFLESIMMAFGLTPADYESSSGAGYGSYTQSNDKHRALLQTGYDNFNTVRNRRLPGWLKS